MTQAPMPPPPPGPTGPFASQMPPRGQGMAVAALVLGILSFIPLCGLVGIILAIVVLATRRPGKGMAIAGLILPFVIVPLFLVAILIPSVSRTQKPGRRSICGANLNSIGKHLIIYTTEYEQIPPDIDTLVRQGLGEKTLVCPSASAGRKRDYFIHFPKEEPDLGSAIVACDYRGNHADGRYVLTYQGSIKFVRGEAAFQAELNQPWNAEFAKALRAAEGP
ncbi:MAG TPA: DUF4190 domain-containing protein [Phycisphaerae bacterium]|nr:DUF4190 domain-containing protein [Phycisphaerae bacterium]